ncbi:gamma-butyrobetaine dioxygenase-like [Achroia grisella]|uniref:gamma-butyrobetaine dioxygenase-like n=1 Tax=Achroia grisella TaxID=688607 RepID=UPI0027D32EAE|nr:gamma-butyrobetaine dioxygenase-like [Achroia grisella]
MFVLNRVQSINNIFRQVNLIKNALENNYPLKRWLHDHLTLAILGENLSFPYVWLRDNCQCEMCFHQSARSRILDWSNFDLDVKPRDVVRDENSLQVTWTDGHKSKFDLNWLKFRSFTADNQQRYNEAIYKPKKITWSGEQFQKICTKHEYDEILNSDKGLYNWLLKLSTYGVALIQNTPNSETAIDSIVERIGFTKRTHYGVKFIVQHVANTSNVAYLSSNLQMHTDLPYYEYCPGANLLHCLVQTKSLGGENLLSDGHFIAEHIKENYPDQYKLLTEVEVEWSDIGTEDKNDFFKLYRAPVICLDKHGAVTRINFSIPQRGSHFPGTIDMVKPWYEAHRLFLALNHRFSAKFKTKEGDILAFDNIRLLHGRNAYEDNNDNVRKLIGAYVDWDEIYSRLRCLKIKLKSEDTVY